MVMFVMPTVTQANAPNQQNGHELVEKKGNLTNFDPKTQQVAKKVDFNGTTKCVFGSCLDLVSHLDISVLVDWRKTSSYLLDLAS